MHLLKIILLKLRPWSSLCSIGPWTWSLCPIYLRWEALEDEFVQILMKKRLQGREDSSKVQILMTFHASILIASLLEHSVCLHCCFVQPEHGFSSSPHSTWSNGKVAMFWWSNWSFSVSWPSLVHLWRRTLEWINHPPFLRYFASFWE